MAELSTVLPQRRGLGLGAGQLGAILWLRWRIFVNNSRRRGGKAELVFRLLLYPLAFCLFLGPAVLVGFFAWALAMRSSLPLISLVFWGTFALAQLLNINVGQPGTTFDPTELIRFPMTLRSYVLVRLTFGLLGPANVVVTLMSLAIFVGVTVDRPQLWPWTLASAVAFALANVLFSRMIFAWIDRWLSTRRAREVFTALVFAGSLGFQYLNVTYNPGFNHGHGNRRVTPEGLRHAQTFFYNLQPWLRFLPPELSGAAIVSAEGGHYIASLRATALVLLYAIAFLTIYALRMRTEYAGENLSDQANAVSRPDRPSASTAPTAPVNVGDTTTAIRPAFPAGGVAKTLAPLISKEFLLLRRNTGLLYGVIAPTVMVFLFAGRLSLRGSSHWLLPAAVAYALLGLAPMSYNAFGMEGPGAQLYFMTPVPLREVFLAKNVMHFLLAGFEVLVVVLVVGNVAGRPHPLDVLFVILWSAATLLLNVSIGNLRSVSAPKKINPTRSLGRTQSQLSAWIAIGMLAGSAALGSGFLAVAAIFHLPWLSVVLAAVFAGVAIVVYLQGLSGIEAYTMDRRELLMEELGKKT